MHHEFLEEPAPSGDRETYSRTVGGQSPLLHAPRVPGGAGSVRRSGDLLTNGRGTEPPPTNTTSSWRSRLRPAIGRLTHERSGDRAPSYKHHEFLEEPAPSGDRETYSRTVGGQSPLLQTPRVPGGAGSVRRSGGLTILAHEPTTFGLLTSCTSESSGFTRIETTGRRIVGRGRQDWPRRQKAGTETSPPESPRCNLEERIALASRGRGHLGLLEGFPGADDAQAV